MAVVAQPVFAALADPTRLGILAALRKRERSVGELVDRFSISQPAISKHLKLLEKHGFIEKEVRGNHRVCRLKSDGFVRLQAWLTDYNVFWDDQLAGLSEHFEKKKSHARNPSRNQQTS